MKTIPVFAHRGASHDCLENTFAAFKKAQSLGADGIELDLQISKDGILVVFHDLDLKRLAGKKRKVSDSSFEELRSYKLGKRFIRFFSNHRIEAFQDILDWANEQQIPLNIELKQSLLMNEAALRQFLVPLQVPKNSHFSSFHERLLIIVKEARPEMETAYIVTKKFDWSLKSEHRFFDTIHAHKKFYKHEYLQYCKDAAIGIRFYGIVGNESFLKNPHPAVRGWITDFPDKVQRAQLK
ncbi:glycerophosphodiester phosphodiesterase [Solibacillus sp. MA9]|uniref:Glycerophosphodiester phosphodiesterase n=1 Tax=Solibacillus palustris TaxID=2908203 RepID=A0ABS9UC30_9BACL|nr:glycerophosphodiester phosphodiesterase family protein [Solibacillus sp. MA9]MCH7321882.1 glycerophosphodiester phosphodiesterase [Solibacillus sp. MA9]